MPRGRLESGWELGDNVGGNFTLMVRLMLKQEPQKRDTETQRGESSIKSISLGEMRKFRETIS